MKTLLHIIDTTGPGGAETIFIQLAKKFNNNSRFKSIALIKGNGWVQSELERFNIDFIVLDCKGSFNFKYLMQIIKIVFIYKIDLIQSHLLGSNVYSSIVGLITRTPVISTFHGLVDISPTEKFRLIKLLFIQLGSKKIIGVTDKLSEMLVSLPLLSRSKVKTIYNGIELEQYTKIPSADFREKLLVKKEEILIGSLGNIRSPKNYPLAIKSIKLLHSNNVKVHYAIAGDGNEEQMRPLLTLIKELELENYIHLLGFTKNTQEFLSSLNVFLMTSTSEGHPLALTQAMANGLPIVSTLSGVELIVTNNSDAILAKDMTPEEIAKSITYILDNPKISNELSIKAKEKALEYFSIDKMLNQYECTYEAT